MAAREVLEIVYKNPRLNPRQIHAKRTLQLYEPVNNVLFRLRKQLHLVKSENGEYTITPLGSEHVKFLRSLDRIEDVKR